MPNTQVTQQYLIDLFAGKRVVIIGPSPHLEGKDLGSLIDSYDVVCRVNDFGTLTLQKDYGSRTDVMFHNCADHILEEMKEKMDSHSEICKSMKLVVVPTLKSARGHRWEGWNENTEIPTTKNFVSLNKHNVPFCHIGFNNYKFFYSLVGTEPNSGILSILWILYYQCVKELFVTGFSFYVQGNKYQTCYRKDYMDEKYHETGFNPHAGHNLEQQKKFFNHFLLARYGEIITIDSVLNGVLGANHNKVIKV